jgi:hypothetical protein
MQEFAKMEKAVIKFSWHTLITCTLYSPRDGASLEAAENANYGHTIKV